VKKTLAVAVAVVFVLSFAAPVFAEMDHEAEYHLDGTIDLEKQVGHLCNTGAEMKQAIDGEGEMTKLMDTNQVAGVITVDDQQDWVTAEDAVNNLTVTSVIELCAPAKTVYDAEDADEDGDTIPPELLYLMDHDDLNLDDDGFFDYASQSVYQDELTDQIWAVQVEADPGFSGGLEQNFEAAYGPFASAEDYWYGDETDEPADAFWFEDEDGNEIAGNEIAAQDLSEFDSVASGDDYVGNYFNIDQFARTSEGTTQRYIDISSPWSGAYLSEDMTVTGAAEIEEEFEMDNLEPGPDTVPDWWDLF